MSRSVLWNEKQSYIWEKLPLSLYFVRLFCFYVSLTFSPSPVNSALVAKALSEIERQGYVGSVLVSAKGNNLSVHTAIQNFLRKILEKDHHISERIVYLPIFVTTFMTLIFNLTFSIKFILAFFSFLISILWLLYCEMWYNVNWSV